MSYLTTCLTMFMITSAATRDLPSLQERLESMVWTNRVVLLYAPNGESKLYKEQKRLFASQSAEFRDRDLVVIECTPEQLSSADQTYLIRQFQANPEAFGVWLIGKDGTVKLQSGEPVGTKKLFGLIDSMPMRRSEMKRND